MADPTNVLRRFQQSITLYRSQGTTNVDGNARWTFDAAVEIEASIRPPPRDRGDFEVDVGGQSERARLVMDVLDEYDVEADDRVDYKGDAWRAVERIPAPYHGFERFALIEDSRVPAGDSNTSTEGPDEGSGGNYEVIP